MKAATMEVLLVFLKIQISSIKTTIWFLYGLTQMNLKPEKQGLKLFQVEQMISFSYNQYLAVIKEGQSNLPELFRNFAKNNLSIILLNDQNTLCWISMIKQTLF